MRPGSYSRPFLFQLCVENFGKDGFSGSMKTRARISFLLVIITALVLGGGLEDAIAAPDVFVCSGTTTARNMEQEHATPFNARFVIDTVAKSWLRVDPATSVPHPLCTTPDCTITVDGDTLTARTGTLVVRFDRRHRTLTAGDLKTVGDVMVELITKASCRAASADPAPRSPAP
ncbi:hypothetical protein ACMAUO_08075 [Gluconacetobacter sp. Hr-1-5]|uniref:hypothetical protein n=1 Tax=Gluconacetobacter sp. Hr-1-5 TaxID=3395370 RepID=UPI003B51D4BA